VDRHPKAAGVGRRVGGVVDEPCERGDARHAVGHAVVDLQQHGDLPVTQTGEQRQLPQRARTVQTAASELLAGA
jgi:hypothetical protein